jgi:hypothetical protein
MKINETELAIILMGLKNYRVLTMDRKNKSDTDIYRKHFSKKAKKMTSLIGKLEGGVTELRTAK